MYAHTDIKSGGVDDDGNHVMTYFDEGDEVAEGDLPDDQYQTLVDLGVLQSVPPIKDPGVITDVIAAKDEEIAMLKALLKQEGVTPGKTSKDDAQVAKDAAEAAAKDAEIQALKAQLAANGIQPEPVVPPTDVAEKAAKAAEEEAKK